MARKWTKCIVLDALRLRHRRGPPLCRVWKDDKPLFRAAVRNFGNWQNALQAAGLDVKRRRSWSSESILDELRCWHRRGDFNIRVADPQLTGAAARFFGNLSTAWEAAGLDPPPGRWTKRRVVEAIQERYVRRRPIEFAGFKDKALAAAAKRHFGTWRAAVAAAGLLKRMPETTLPRRWTPRAVIEAIQARNQRGGIGGLWIEDTGLYSVAKKHFGSWRNAVQAAGLEPGRRRWTPQLVIQEIQTRHQRGLSLLSAVWREDSRLAAAATRLFGGWPKALNAAGISLPSSEEHTGTIACLAKT